MKSIFISMFAVFYAFGILKAQSEIDYRPKSLLKELSGTNGHEPPSLSEIALPPALENVVFRGKFFTIGNHISKSQNRYVYVGRVNSCRSGGCSPNADIGSDQNSEYFDYFILFNESCSVQLIKVYNYQATHGQEISASGWLKQFIGYGIENDLKIGEDIDAISGATISVAAITYDIRDKTRMLKDILLKSGLGD